MLIAVMLIGSYLLGAIPTAFLVGKRVAGIDVRTRGSGNAGATNVARVLGMRPGLVVALIDVCKGLAAVLLLSLIAPLPGHVGAVLCGAAAMLGHVFPVFLLFRGGKGVATAAGAAIPLFPVIAPVCLVGFLVVAAIGRRVSLASLVAAFLLPALYLVSCLLWQRFDPWLAGFAVFVLLLVTFTHRGNIARLARGTEKPFEPGRLLRRPR
jgi:acyl phosphate:glycerol-3-phosphate acyltransferase